MQIALSEDYPQKVISSIVLKFLQSFGNIQKAAVKMALLEISD